MRLSNEQEDFEKIWTNFDSEMTSRGFSLARPWSNEWEVEGRPWVKESRRVQIWVYMVPKWNQEEVMGSKKNHHSIYGHIQRGRVLDRFELKPRSLTSLKNMVPKALTKIDAYIDQMDSIV